MNSKDYFEKVADQWDQMRRSFFSDKVRKVAVAKADIQAGKLAADIGAGTGFVTEELVQNGLKVIAVDQSGGMLEEMKKKFGRIDTVEYRIGDFNNLPLQNETVDYVFANMYLHHVDLPQVAIEEMARVLKPGGKVVITDMDEHKFEFLKKEQHDRWLGFKREDVERWFNEAGLKNVRVECMEEECCADSVECGEKASVSLFVAYGEKS
ncbi:MAG: methyltransferase domain-containing protein [Candidatus Aminicenantes bacterium]|nr:MAG: methyltransferase domain-containing protein [Candidatus Aminicenantes bacterium]